MAFGIPVPTSEFVNPKTGLLNRQWYLFLNNVFNSPAISGITSVASGGTGLASGTSGGIPGFTSATTIASSAVLGANQLILGGGAGATPSALGTLGTTTQVLHGNAGGTPTFSQVALGTDVSGTLAAAQFPALTGDITTPSGSLVTTIATNAVTNAKAAQMGARTIKGNNTGAIANAADLSAGQFPATQTNDNASAGNIGEFVTATAAPGAINPGTGVSANVTSISLTAGDWDVSGTINFTYGATTSVTNLAGGPSSVSATLPTQDNIFDFETAAQVPTGGAVGSIPTPVVRFSLAVTTTIYLVVQATFTISSLTMGGTIRARRMR